LFEHVDFVELLVVPVAVSVAQGHCLDGLGDRRPNPSLAGADRTLDRELVARSGNAGQVGLLAETWRRRIVAAQSRRSREAVVKLT
jgi:hypothetical protein